MTLQIKPGDACAFDLISLGEVMVRLSPPGHERLEFASSFDVHVGGGEYNVAYALARLGLRTGWVGGLVENPLGWLVRNHARAQGVDISHAISRPYDGVGRAVRMGLHFVEVGSGSRASVSVYDRGHTATASIVPGEVDWESLFGEQGVRWFHTGGIYTCLSDAARKVVVEAMEIAHRLGTFVSYDLNFRSKLWDTETAIAATRPLVPYIDCLIGNEEDFQKVLGFDVEGTDPNLAALSIDHYKSMVRRLVETYPNLKLVGTTLREVLNANENNWSAILYSAETDTFFTGPRFERMIIEDRVGGGDGFASGMAFAFLSGSGPQRAVDLGTSHGALLQTTRGDTSQITLDELEHVAAGGSARISR